MLKNKVFYKNDVSDKILMVLPRASDKDLNNLKGLPLCELVTFETTPFMLQKIRRNTKYKKFPRNYKLSIALKEYY